MEKIVKFLIQGSGKEPYRCTFWKVDNYDLHSACTCPAGKKGQYCKHRFALLEGDITNVVDYSEEDLEEKVRIYCEEKKLTRSDFLRNAINRELNEK